MAPFWGIGTGKQNQKMNDINLKIHQFIKDKLGVEESAITDSASFYDDLDVDSLDFCELIVDIEKAFDITIPDDMYEKFKTVGSLVNYVSKQSNLKTSSVPEMSTGLEERMSA
jgi:acyl carrier protein